MSLSVARPPAAGTRIGELLVQRGVVTSAQVDGAVRDARARGEPLCSRLLALGVDEGGLCAALADKHGVPGVDLSRTAVPLRLLDLVPRRVAEGDLILPLSETGGRLHLAMSRPNDERILAEVRFVTGREVSPYIAVKSSLSRAITEAYDARERGEALWAGAAADAFGPGVAALVPGVGEVPVGAEDGELVVDLVDDAPEEVEIVVEPEPVRAGPPRVLVVDDEPEIRKLVERTLVAKGYEVELAVDGAEALAKAEAHVPQLVLLDAMLPKVHGFEACRRLKSGARTRHVPVIMMTAIYRGWRFAQDARDAYGAEDYVEKPFRIEDLLRRMETALSRGAARAADPVDAVAPELARGKELLAAGDLVEAVAVLTRATQSAPYSADAHFQLGRALRAQGDHFRAMTALERAAELRPTHLVALRALAALYEETGFRRKAAEILERELALAPDDDGRAALRDELLKLIA